MNKGGPQAKHFFLHEGGRSLFAVHHLPDVPAPRGGILFVPAFMEEQNKSRRMVAEQARALAKAGWHVLQLDLSGCGDSSGAHAEATWDIWLDDIAAGQRWLSAQVAGPIRYWGMRLGALLCMHSLQRNPLPDVGLLFWQPVISGAQYVQQVLRLKLAAEGSTTTTAALMGQLQDGETLEVAGYGLAPGLILPMAEAKAVLPAGGSRIDWLEVSPRPDATLTVAAQRQVEAWSSLTAVEATVVRGPSFWQTLEIESAPALLAQTLAVLGR